MALKKGVCKNFYNCTLADNNEIQEVDSSEFKCTECGKELHEIPDEDPHPNPKIILIIVAALILIGGGIWAYFGLIKDRPEKEKGSVSLSLNKEVISLYVGESDTLKATVYSQPEDANITVFYTSDNENVAHIGNNGIVKAVGQGEASITVVAQTETGIADTALTKVIVDKLEEPTPQPDDTVKGKTKTPTTASKPVRYSYLSFGTLDGSLSYDNNATIKVTKQHTMALKDAKQSTIVVYPGDELRQCRIRNGILESFQIISKNGNRESILDAQEKLN